MDAAKQTLSHSALPTLRDSPSPANGAQAAARPHLTELRQKLLNPDPAAAAALSTDYANATSAQDREAIGRELAARQAINLLGGGDADRAEKEFIVLQLLVGDEGGFDDKSIQEVTRKLAGLSATIARRPAPQAPDSALALLQVVAQHYAQNLRMQRGGDLDAAHAAFHAQVRALAKEGGVRANAPGFQSIVQTFDEAVGLAAKPVPKPVPATQQAAAPAMAARTNLSPQPTRLEARATEFVHQALTAADRNDAHAITKDARLLAAQFGRPALDAMVDATLDAMVQVPASNAKQRWTLATLAWSLASHPKASKDKVSTPSLTRLVDSALHKAKDDAARTALFADIGEAARRAERGATDSLKAAIEQAAAGKSRDRLLAAATTKRSLIQTWREPSVIQLPGMRVDVDQARAMHEAMATASSPLEALQKLLLPGEMEARKDTPATFLAHARQVLDLLRARDRDAALADARACLAEVQAAAQTAPRDLHRALERLQQALQESVNELENANSPEGLRRAGLLPRESQASRPEAEVIPGLADLLSSVPPRAASKPVEKNLFDLDELFGEKPRPDAPARPLKQQVADAPARSRASPAAKRERRPAPAPTSQQTIEIIRAAQGRSAADVINHVAQSIVSAPRQWIGDAFAQACGELTAKYGAKEVDVLLPQALLQANPVALGGNSRRRSEVHQRSIADGYHRAAGFALSLMARRKGLMDDADVTLSAFMDAACLQPPDTNFRERLARQMEELGQVCAADFDLQAHVRYYIDVELGNRIMAPTRLETLQDLMTRSFEAGVQEKQSGAEKARVFRDADLVKAATGKQERLRTKARE